MAHIVHFAKYYLPESGGIERVTVSLARGAAADGHTVAVVCFRPAGGPRREQRDGVTVIGAPVAVLLASQPLGLRYLLCCLHAARQAEVVHLHVPNMLGALAALMIGRRARLLVHWHSDVLDKGWLGRLLRPLEHALLRRADGIVATSRIYAEASDLLPRYAHKVAVVPIGIAPVDPAGALPDWPPPLEPRCAGRRIILAVGRLVPYKGFAVLIQAAAQLPSDVLVVIVGGGPLQATLQAAIDTAGLGPRVLLAGRLSDAALHALFLRASLFCLPSTSRAEAFGVVLLEAMAYRLPIVATAIAGSAVPWVNQQDVSGLNVAVGDPHALAQACNRILASDTLRGRLAQGAQRRFLAEFTEAQAIRRMLTVYQRVLAADRPPGAGPPTGASGD